jgi:hypothetical protein
MRAASSAVSAATLVLLRRSRALPSSSASFSLA